MYVCIQGFVTATPQQYRDVLIVTQPSISYCVYIYMLVCPNIRVCMYVRDKLEPQINNHIRAMSASQ
jgi:hypothetical protein